MSKCKICNEERNKTIKGVCMKCMAIRRNERQDNEYEELAANMGRVPSSGDMHDIIKRNMGYSKKFD